MEYIKEPEKVKLHVVNPSCPSFTTWLCVVRSAVIVIKRSMLLMWQSSSDTNWVSEDQIKTNGKLQETLNWRQVQKLTPTVYYKYSKKLFVRFSIKFNQIKILATLELIKNSRSIISLPQSLTDPHTPEIWNLKHLHISTVHRRYLKKLQILNRRLVSQQS